MNRPLLLLAAILLLLGGASCGGREALVDPDSPLGRARAYYGRTCAACHGEDGRGDTEVARALDPRPADFTSAAWQDGVSDERIAKAIIAGGAGVGRGSTMPIHPALEDKPKMVRLLVRVVREFAAGGVVLPAPAGR